MTPAEVLAALTGVSAILNVINSIAASAKERGEWTPEQEAEFDAKIEEVTQQSWWKKND